jgi:hypothetical protein
MIAIGVFLTIIAWVVIDIYHIQSAQDANEVIKPVSLSNYEINKKVIEILLNKKAQDLK